MNESDIDRREPDPGSRSLYQIQEKERILDMKQVKQKTIKCKDSGMYGFKLKKLGRVKRIFCDKMGRAYYNRGNMRTYLDTVERLSYPYFYEDDKGKLGYVSGYEYIGAFSPIYVEILGDGESVQLWTEF